MLVLAWQQSQIVMANKNANFISTVSQYCFCCCPAGSHFQERELFESLLRTFVFCLTHYVHYLYYVYYCQTAVVAAVDRWYLSVK
jgi:hypothetical protein